MSCAYTSILYASSLFHAHALCVCVKCKTCSVAIWLHICLIKLKMSCTIVIATHYYVLDCYYAITDSTMTDQIIEKVAGDVADVNEESNTAQSHSDSEDLFQRWYREGYDIYDEAYVRWLMVHHPGDVKSEWLTKTATTSKSFEPDQPSEKSQVYNNVKQLYS